MGVFDIVKLSNPLLSSKKGSSINYYIMKKALVTLAFVLTWFSMCVSCSSTKNENDSMNENTENAPEYKTVKLGTAGEDIQINVGDTLTYSESTYGSVGYYYNVLYDTTAFEAHYRTKYYRPEDVEMGMCGADEGVSTTMLTALKKGTYTITVESCYRGDVEGVQRYTVTVN